MDGIDTSIPYDGVAASDGYPQIDFSNSNPSVNDGTDWFGGLLSTGQLAIQTAGAAYGAQQQAKAQVGAAQAAANANPLLFGGVQPATALTSISTGGWLVIGGGVLALALILRR